MPHEKPIVKFLTKPDGNHDVAILIPNVRIKRNHDGTEWKIIDHGESLPQPIICDGEEFRPKLILKLYCKASGAKAGRMRRRYLIEQFRRGERSIKNALPL